jgi:hypothetical protein
MVFNAKGLLRIFLTSRNLYHRLYRYVGSQIYGFESISHLKNALSKLNKADFVTQNYWIPKNRYKQLKRLLMHLYLG